MLGRRRGLQVAAGIAVLALAAAACGGSSKKSNNGGSSGNGNVTQGQIKASDPNTVNSVSNPAKGGTLTYALEKTISNWNILTSAGNTFETAEVIGPHFPAGDPGDGVSDEGEGEDLVTARE